MPKHEIANLDLKIKYTKEYLENGGYEKMWDARLLDDLEKVITGSDGKVDPNSVNTNVNSFMMGILASHQMPPVFHPEHISEYYSLLQKSYSYGQENIDSEEQFDKIYEEYSSKENILFRGQREAKWRLYSLLQRQWILDKLFNKGESYQNFIERLVEIGRNEFGEQIKLLLNSKHKDILNNVSVLSYLQHHGCPTPLLDWSYKFQVALFFAINKLESNLKTREIEDYCSIYYIEEEHFQEGNLGQIIKAGILKIEQDEMAKKIAERYKGNEDVRKKMEEHFAGNHLFNWKTMNFYGIVSQMTKISHLMQSPFAYFSDNDKDSNFLLSIVNNKNIQNQAGVFTWNASDSKPIELIGEDINLEEFPEMKERNYKFCKCLNINKRLESHIRKRLEVDGITKDFIFPTLDLTTWHIFEKCKT